MNFFQKHWWKSNYTLPASFILFFVLAFFLLGEQLSALPTYLGAPPDGTVHILDKAWNDALHRPIFYFLFAIIAWLVFRFFHWFLAFSISEVALSLLIHMPSEDISKLGEFRIDKFIVISVLTFAPYFTFKVIDKKWGAKGQRRILLVLVAINILLLGFFAYQIYFLHHSYRGLDTTSQQQQYFSTNQKAFPTDSKNGGISEQSLSTPYFDESDIESVNEAFSAGSQAPWGFQHGGIDFMAARDLVTVRAVIDGKIDNVQLYQLDSTGNWQVGLTLIHGGSVIIYGFEPFSSDEKIGREQLAKIAVRSDQIVQAGDIIGRLRKTGDSSHVHFGVVPKGSDASGQECPKAYFTKEARESVLRIIHKNHPNWQMCY